MSDIIFLCSGNTCRSPMAAGMARKVFGLSHNIVSAGAETALSLPAACNAIKAMAEMQVDILGHTTTDVGAYDLSKYDWVVVFRPSAANLIPFPQNFNIEYFDIADPFGGDLNNYRLTARLIRQATRALYAKDVLRRVQSGVMGSHAQGMYNRAAKELEDEINDFITKNFNMKVGRKPTLGRLGASISTYAKMNNERLLCSLAEAISRANDIWVTVKHEEVPGLETLKDGLAHIVNSLNIIMDYTRWSIKPASR